MKYTTARDFRTALEARLKSSAGTRNQRGLVQLRKQIAFERFLARLIAISPDNWILKGGTALNYRLGYQSRFTKDLDIALAKGIQGVADIMLDAMALDLNDFFFFSLQLSTRLNHAQQGSSSRYSIQCRLDNRLFESFLVDVGFDEPTSLVVGTISGSNFLEFAEIDNIDVPILPAEVHLAEKLHAYSKPYTGNRLNTRVKDLVDIVLLAITQSFIADNVRAALAHTFDSRATHPLPEKLEPSPPTWSGPYAELARSVSLDPDIAVGLAYAAKLLDPLLGGEVESMAVWDSVRLQWIPE